MVHPRPLLLTFVLFKHKFYRKNVGFSWIWTFIVGIEGEHTDHLTATAAQVVDHACPVIEVSGSKYSITWPPPYTIFIPFINGLSPASVSFFLSFQAIITIFPTNTCEKMYIEYPALGLNPQPFEHEFPPITTRPGLFFYFTYRATSLFRVGKVWNRLRQATASKTFAHLSLSARVESPNDESQ